MIERSAYKDRFYARHLVFPFTRSFGCVHLSYSNRIRHGIGHGPETFEGPPAEIARQLLESIRDQDLVRQFERPYSPRQFLDRFSTADISVLPIERAYDIGTAAALAGEFGMADHCFRTIQAKFAQHNGFPLSAHTVTLLDELNESVAALHFSGQALQDHLHGCCRRNAQSLGFESALWDR